MAKPEATSDLGIRPDRGLITFDLAGPWAVLLWGLSSLLPLGDKDHMRSKCVRPGNKAVLSLAHLASLHLKHPMSCDWTH